MLHLKKVLGAKPKEHAEAELATLMTPWGASLDFDHVLEEHPEPQFAREAFQTLNGVWDCAFVSSGHAPTDDLQRVVKQAKIPDATAFSQTIVVPFSPEAPLSGVGRQLKPDELLWYRRPFETPRTEKGNRVLLHFQAVDFACAVYVNGHLAATHAGGYAPFCLDVTDLLASAAQSQAHPSEGDDETSEALDGVQAKAKTANASALRDYNPDATPQSANELLVCVADPSEQGGHLRGKQRLDRGDIWYTAQSGIWQTVWLEIVPQEHVESLVIEPDLQTGILSIGARLSLPEDEQSSPDLHIQVIDAAGDEVANASCTPAETSCALAMHIPDVHAWSPDDPYLYRLRITYGTDVVNSYCGFRTVELAKDERGHKRVFLNGKPLFIRGVLDQAYWSDGLMTAPADDALVYDIQAMRDDGFNLMRKHIKIENSRWYYHCDRLGMLVLQDMVNGGDPEIRSWQWSYKPTLFKVSWNHYRDNTDRHRKELGSGDKHFREEWATACCETIRQLQNHPCIIGWSLFNEGWGQFDAVQMTKMARMQDPTRIIDSTSGWYDQGCGDFNSVHNYFRDMKVWKDRKAGRAFFISEFGGYTHRVDGHSALDEAYGYEPYDDLGEWQRAVRALLAEMDAMEADGLAGYIFTQVSDIEEETNGILTYDRHINKLASA